ncbi:nucleotide pyrophosphohydrolase [Bdellovibrio bacteriovorus]|uniref:nucleotide pyrophosphohydrolase n=1 Tax=Bdellovibrio bacteriovorus TaxID=959 RepID=UPI0035A90C85
MKSNIEDLTSFIKTFCEERDWDQFHSPKDLAIGVSTEANELLELFRFKSEAEVQEKMNTPEFKEKVSDELADIFFFVLRFAQMNKIDITEAFKAKMQKNAQKYSVEKAKGSNKKYNE